MSQTQSLQSDPVQTNSVANPEALAPQEDFDKFIEGSQMGATGIKQIEADREKAFGVSRRPNTVSAIHRGGVALAHFVELTSPFTSHESKISESAIAQRARETKHGRLEW